MQIPGAAVMDHAARSFPFARTSRNRLPWAKIAALVPARMESFLSKPSPTRYATAAALSCAFVLAGLPFAAAAQVFKCTRPDGSVAFQGSPCPGSIKAQPAPAAAPAKVAASTSAPFDDPYAQAPGSGQRAGLVLPPTRNVAAEPVAAAPRQRARPAAEPRVVTREHVKTPEEERLDQENEKAIAYNRSLRCNHARQQLGVFVAQRPVYSTDNKGERHYVEDADRAKATEAAQRRVDEECR